jgi:AraC-like DNA-binding protein
MGRPPKIWLYQRIVKAMLYMEEHYAEPIMLDKISDAASFSEFHFIREFKKIYGKSPKQYLSSVRISKAKLLLEEGMSVSEACHAAGFESLSSFSTLFRKHIGLSPSAYRAEQLELKERMKNDPFDFIPGCFTKSNFR